MHMGVLGLRHDSCELENLAGAEEQDNGRRRVRRKEQLL